MKAIIIITMCFSVQLVCAQKVKEIINGPRSQNGKIVFDASLACNVTEMSKTGYEYLPDESIINLKALESKNGEQKYFIYIKAYNPLHYSVKQSSKLITDSLYFKAKAAITDMIQLIQSLSNEMEMMEQQLENDNISTKCLELTKDLIRLNFKDKGITQNEVDRIGDELTEIREAFLERKTDMEKAAVATLSENDWVKDELSILNMQNMLLASSSLINNEAILLAKVESLHQAVVAFLANLKGDKDDDGWFYLLESKAISKTKMAEIKLEIIEHKIEVKDGKVFQNENKTIAEKHFFIRQYSRFIPEVSAGVVYANHNYSGFEIGKNNLGESIIVRGEDKMLNKFSLSTMVNFNFNSPVILPAVMFLQVGAGVSEKVPIGLLGAGFKFGSSAFKNFAVSTGVSFTGVEQLDKLVEGQIVKDNQEIQEDLHYRISKPKIYFGVQYNF